MKNDMFRNRVRMLFLPAISLSLLLAAPRVNAESNFQIGLGANYWVALDDAVDQSFDEDGLGWMISSRYMFTDYLGIGLEVERSPDNYIQFEDPVYCPAAYLILGKGLYGAVGVGTYYYDGDFYEDVFYALRVGIAAELLPHIILDINANYRSDKWSNVKDADSEVDTDNVILGAAVRLKF